jgi:hypothetical protein
LYEGCDAGLTFRIVRWQGAQHKPDAPHAFVLLRTRRERPCGSTAKTRYEFAPVHSRHSLSGLRF